MEPAIVAESARWGDAVRTWGGGYQTCGQDKGDAYPPATKAHWDSGILRIIGWMTGRTELVFGWIKNRTELHYPSKDPPVLRINGASHYGGYITMGSTFSMTKSGSGGIYCTLD